MTGFRFVDEHQAEYRVTDLCRVGGVSRVELLRLAVPAALGSGEGERGAVGGDPRDPRTLPSHLRGAAGPGPAPPPRAPGLAPSRGPPDGRRGPRRGARPAEVAPGPAPDRWSPHRTCCSATSPRRAPICAGWPTSPSSPARTASSSWRPSGTCTITRSWAGRWANARPPTSSSPRWSWPSGDASRAASWSITPTTERTTRHWSSRTASADWKLNGSYGSVGDAFDNAAMEAFWATLKKEVHHIWGPHRGLHAQRAPHDPVRLHRGLLQPLTTPGRPRPPHPARGPTRPTAQPDPPETPCPRDRGNSKPRRAPSRGRSLR